jgi:hypothetical protein
MMSACHNVASIDPPCVRSWSFAPRTRDPIAYCENDSAAGGACKTTSCQGFSQFAEQPAIIGGDKICHAMRVAKGRHALGTRNPVCTCE